MPTYEYECPTCNKKFEQLQKITDPPLKKCPTCGGHVRRLISSGVGLIFKGSGFYCTDYKNKSDKEGSKKGQSNQNKPPSCQNCPASKNRQ